MSFVAIIGFLLPSALVALFAEWRARRIHTGEVQCKPATLRQRGSLYFDLGEPR